jgi:outer membrane protein assembly factor BamB
MWLSPTTGETLSQDTLSSGGYLGPVVADNTLYLLTDDARLSAYR